VIRTVVVNNNEFPGKVVSHSHCGNRIEGPPQRFRAIKGTNGNRYEQRSCPASQAEPAAEIKWLPLKDRPCRCLLFGSASILIFLQQAFEG
jgi:hypothetical protein